MIMFLKSKFTLTLIYSDIYRTGQHRAVDFDHVPYQVGIHFCNRFPQLFSKMLQLSRHLKPVEKAF